MKKIFVDTNVWLRFLVADDETKFTACQKLLEKVEKGKLKVYTSNIVLLELIYTLTTFYKIGKKQIIKDVIDLLSTRNITLIDKTNFRNALELFSKFRIKLADCLIVTQLPPKTILCTYDQDFKKFKGFPSLTPEEITN